jgi:hypothetical protein
MRKKVITRRHLRTVQSLERRLLSLSYKIATERRPWSDSTCHTLWNAMEPLGRLMRTNGHQLDQAQKENHEHC